MNCTGGLTPAGLLYLTPLPEKPGIRLKLHMLLDCRWGCVPGENSESRNAFNAQNLLKNLQAQFSSNLLRHLHSSVVEQNHLTQACFIIKC